MKILHVTPDFNFMTKFVLPFVEYQVLKGDDVAVITSRYEYSSDLIPKRKNQIEVKATKIIELNLKLALFNANFIKGVFKFFRLLRGCDYDVIVCHTSIDSFLPILMVKLFSNCRIIYFNHGVPALGYNFVFRWILSVIEFSNIVNAHQVFTITAAMIPPMRRVSFGLKAIQLVQPGSACGLNVNYEDYTELINARAVAREKLNIKREAFVILYVGRATKRKGLYDLLAAVELLHPHPKLIIVGPISEDIEGFYKYAHCDISVVGYKSNVDQYYLASDVLCIPSHHEGLGYCYLEAASLGCVPISSDIPGPTDFVVNMKTGLSVKCGCKHSISEALKFLMNNRNVIKDISLQAFIAVKKYDRKLIIPRMYEQIKRSIVKNDLF